MPVVFVAHDRRVRLAGVLEQVFHLLGEDPAGGRGVADDGVRHQPVAAGVAFQLVLPCVVANDPLRRVTHSRGALARDHVVEAIGRRKADDVVLGIAGVDVGDLRRGALPQAAGPRQPVGGVGAGVALALVLGVVLQDVGQVKDAPVRRVVVRIQQSARPVRPDAPVGVVGEHPLALGQVEVDGHPDLAQVGPALCGHRRLARRHQRGHEDADEDGDDPDHNQQLDECERRPPPRVLNSHAGLP